jgi:NADH:ubiquinone oxidoreductase subunit D
MPFCLSRTQVHYEEVESEYQIVVQQAEEIRDYWNEHNKERIANISKLLPKPEYASAWQKLQARKAKRVALSQ